MSSHILTLKIGSPLTLIRNLDALKLCNGTRFAVKKLSPNSIEATIIGGKCKVEDMLILRISMNSNWFAIKFQVTQFPESLAFAITINKDHCQSLSIVGLNLQNFWFSHGKLYVAFSSDLKRQRIFMFTHLLNKLKILFIS